MSLPKVRLTKAGIPWIPHQVRDDLVTALGADKETKKPIIKRYGMTEDGILWIPHRGTG